VGFEQAKKTVTGFLNEFILSDEAPLREEAAKLKCKFAISIADCYSIALAIIKNVPLYMKREIEIDSVLQENELPAQIKFIDDL